MKIGWLVPKIQAAEGLQNKRKQMEYFLLIGDVANSKRPLVIIPKVQLRLRVTRRSATAFARYPQKLAKNFLRVKIS